jgi:hypothetical protein
MLKFYSKLFGEDYRLLVQDTPASRKKVILMGNALFVPVIIWLISVWALTANVMDEPWLVALICALIASFLIFMLERSIVMASGKKLIFFFRIFLGFFVATLGSLAIDEIVFKNDIEQQLQANLNSAIANEEKQIEQEYEKRLAAQHSLIMTNKQSWAEALDVARKEADGTGGSGIKGVHAITKIKMEIAEKHKADYDASLAGLRELEDLLRKDKLQRKDIITASFNHHGILNRIKAMFDLVRKDAYMLVVYIITTIIFFGMEFLVILLKMTMPKTNYELKLEMIERIGRQRMERMEAKIGETYDPSRSLPESRKTDELLRKTAASSVFRSDN